MNRQQMLLTILAEECAEVAQRASKAIRFGLDEVQEGQLLNNKQRLENELGDLLGVCDMLGLLPNELMRTTKIARVNKYAGLSRQQGCLREETPDGAGA